jgi:Prokaryotic RING finger family 1
VSETVIQPYSSCPHCGKKLIASPDSLPTSSCPACNQTIQIPGPDLVDTASPTAFNASASPNGNSLCAICQSPLSEADLKTACPACHAPYHSDCWAENGGCAVYGCTEVPITEGRKAVEMPVAYWGQEKKPCPLCNREILAAAVRCVHCGSVFKTARPLDSTEFSKSVSQEVLRPRLQRKILWLFIASLLPFTAPVAIIIFFFWQQSRRDDINTLPSLYPAMIKIALLVGAIETAAITLLAMTFALMNH